MSDKKGKEQEKKGDECLKTGVFNWKCDYAGAATYYDEAVKLYLDVGRFKEVTLSNLNRPYRYIKS